MIVRTYKCSTDPRRRKTTRFVPTIRTMGTGLDKCRWAAMGPAKPSALANSPSEIRSNVICSVEKRGAVARVCSISCPTTIEQHPRDDLCIIRSGETFCEYRFPGEPPKPLSFLSAGEKKGKKRSVFYLRHCRTCGESCLGVFYNYPRCNSDSHSSSVPLVILAVCVYVENRERNLKLFTGTIVIAVVSIHSWMFRASSNGQFRI